MNAKIGITILAVVCVGFAVAVVVIKQQADARQAENVSTIADFSNQIVKANANIADLNQANLNLSSDLATNQVLSQALSNQLAETTGILASTTASLQSAQQQITNLNDHISDLEAQNQVLDQRANSLSNTIATLNTQITDTESKLASSETNNAFLDDELKEQMAQRAKLEQKFNDLKEVRAQVRKLRDDMIVARELAMLRAGIDPNKQVKGGQLLMQHAPAAKPAAPAASPPSYNLNVEVGSDGSVRVIPPLTNSPAANPPAH